MRRSAPRSHSRCSACSQLSRMRGLFVLTSSNSIALRPTSSRMHRDETRISVVLGALYRGSARTHYLSRD